MVSQLLESSTFPAQQYAQSFFSNVPTDARFLQCSFQKILPSSNIDSNTIEFSFDKYDAANIWQIQETYVEVTIQLLKEDGSFPPKACTAAPVNNILHRHY